MRLVTKMKAGLGRASVAILSTTFLAGAANSALLNVEPNVWRDTDTNIEWLSVNQTTTEALGLTNPLDVDSVTDVSSILAAVAVSDYVVNQGFRIATSAEVTALYAGSGGVFDFVDNGYVGPNIPLPDVFNLGAPQSWDEGFPFSVNYGGFVQAGLHSGGAPGSVVYSEVDLATITNANDNQNYIIDGSSYSMGVTPETEYWSYNDYYETRANEMSVYLVRPSVVPIPASLWLFGSALAGLGWLRRRQTV